MSRLFSPLQLRSLTLPNRIVVSPMCQYSAVEGRAQPWHAVHWGRLTLGGAGLVLIEATGVEPAGRISPGCLGLYDDATEQALNEVLRTVRSVGGSAIGIQLGHAGRKASTARPWEGGGAQLAPDAGGWTTVAPSAVPMNDGDAPPHAL
ncbi:MAG: oxidoreductase, partial [Burkholderiales bacterium]